MSFTIIKQGKRQNYVDLYTNEMHFILAYHGKCCTSSITISGKGPAAEKWPEYVGKYTFVDMHNEAPVYVKYTEKMITVKKIKYTIVEERFLFLNDDGKWTVNNVKNDRGVFRGI